MFCVVPKHIHNYDKKLGKKHKANLKDTVNILQVQKLPLPRRILRKY